MRRIAEQCLHCIMLLPPHTADQRAMFESRAFGSDMLRYVVSSPPF